MDENFKKHLKIMDLIKNKKNKRASTKEGKTRRTRKKYEKFKSVQKLDLEGQKAGLEYQAGVAVREAKKNTEEKLKNKNRNPECTDAKKLRCVFYHPKFCNVLGHRSCRSKDCAMHSKTKQQRKEALEYIKAELTQNFARTIKKNSK